MNLATAEQMRHLDQTAIERYGIPGVVLMENAGRGTFQLLKREFGSVRGKLVPIFIGPGNNGGDGLVIGRYVYQNGGIPFLVYLVDPDRLKNDAGINRHTAMQLDLPGTIALDKAGLDRAFRAISDRRNETPVHVIVDALFGTGLTRPLKGLFLDAVNRINRFSEAHTLPVLAVDISSGLNADSGRVMGGCVRADLTATYGLAQPGHFMNGGADLVGALHVVDIGIPKKAIEQAGLTWSAIDADILKLLAQRPATSHKGNCGHLLVLAGSSGKTGAALLSGLGALRVGTGLVSLCVPHELNHIFESSLAEAMTVPLPASKTYLTHGDFDKILKQLPGKNALVVGPGIGTAPETLELVTRLYREAQIPMVVDADGLNILARDPGSMIDPPAPRLLTPHPGEMSRLTGLNTREIQGNRLNATLDFLNRVNRTSANVTMILKGAGTLVCDPAGTWAINTTGNPGMAAGGMGDVLSGLLGGLLAQGYSPAESARLGVFLHGLAADRLAQSARIGFLASEVADIIPALL